MTKLGTKQRCANHSNLLSRTKRLLFLLTICEYCALHSFAGNVTYAENHFQVIQNQEAYGNYTVIETIHIEGMTSVLCASKCQEGCGSFQYSPYTSTCTTFTNTFLSQEQMSSASSDSHLGFKTNPYTITAGSWTLVFRGQKAIRQSFLDVWRSNGTYHDAPLDSSFPTVCLKYEYNATCNQHFRSHILDKWENIAEVSYNIMKDGAFVHAIRFNASQTNREGWFSPHRIIDSSFSNLQNHVSSTPPYFSIAGYESGNNTKRRFNILGTPYYCGSDLFFTYVIDQEKDECEGQWGPPPVDLVNFPQIVYTGSEGPYNWSQVEFADLIFVWVKFAA